MKRFLSVVVLLISSLTISSCSKSPSVERSCLKLNMPGDPATLDPRKGADLTSSTLQFLLFEGLTRMTPYSTVSLAFADDIVISDDLMQYTFYLRDAKWSNGEDITAYDFAQTWLDMLNPHFMAPNAHLLYPIKNAELAKRGKISLREVGIHAVDHRTLQIYLKSPTPYFLELISFCTFFPVSQRIVAKDDHWADPNNNKGFISNGPYRLASWHLGREMVLEKNPYYWDQANVQLEEIRVSFVDNEMTALKMYEMDELDILGLPFTGIPSDSVPSLMDRGVIRESSLPGSTICCFNLSAFPFTNPNIRKAFAYAINRQEIVDNVLQSMGEPGLDLLPSILLSNQPAPFFRDGDKEMARFYFKKGLRELGVSKQELGPVTLLHASTGIYPKVAQALQNQWREVLDVHVQLNGFEYKVFLDKLTQRDYQMGQCVWIAQYFDPTNFFDRFKVKSNAKNYPGYENPEYAKLINDSMLLHVPEERFNLLRKAEEILMEDMPLTAIYHWKNVYLQKPYVKNLLLYPSGSLHLPAISFDLSIKANISQQQDL